MDQQYLINCYKIMSYIQCNFNKKISDDIFNELSDHLYSKWIDCDFNLLNFMSRLDKQNKLILLNWGEQNVEY